MTLDHAHTHPLDRCSPTPTGRSLGRRSHAAARVQLPLMLAAVLLTAAVIAPAARAEWAAPATVSQPHSAIDSLRLASAPAGELLAWRSYDLLAAKGIFGPPLERYALADSSGSFGPERPLPSSSAGAPLLDLGRGRLARLLLLRRGNTSTPAVALGAVNGRFGAPQRVRGASVFAGRASLAGNARGELLLTWIAADRNGYHRVVWASIRAPGGRFGPPQVISSRAEAEQVTAAVGAQGDILVAFPSKFGRMLTRVRRHGRSWGALQDIGPAAGGTENDLTPFVGAGGRMVVAWYETQLCSGGCVSPGFTRAAVQASGSSRFRRPQLLARDAFGLAGAPSGTSLAPLVIALPGHSPMVVLLSRGAHPSPPAFAAPALVEVAYPNGLGFAAPQVISPAGQQAGDLAAATGPTGALVSWIRLDAPAYSTGTVLGAVLASAGGRFAPAEQISPGEQVISAVPVYDASVARHAPLGPWLVAWTARLASPNTVVVRVASPICRDTPPVAVAEPACAGG
jgi:hypothetical protein